MAVATRYTLLTALGLLMLTGLEDYGTVVTSPLSVDHLLQKSRWSKDRCVLLSPKDFAL